MVVLSKGFPTDFFDLLDGNGVVGIDFFFIVLIISMIQLQKSQEASDPTIGLHDIVVMGHQLVFGFLQTSLVDGPIANFDRIGNQATLKLFQAVAGKKLPSDRKNAVVFKVVVVTGDGPHSGIFSFEVLLMEPRTFSIEENGGEDIQNIAFGSAIGGSFISQGKNGSGRRTVDFDISSVSGPMAIAA